MGFVRRYELRRMIVLSAIQGFVAGLVHPSAAADELTIARHRTFIASHLFSGILAFALLPLFLVTRGAPSPIELLTFLWLITPALVALDLSRHGNLNRAHLMSAFSLAGLILVIGGITGGVTSFAMVWLAIVPFEAAFSGSRRIIMSAVGLCAAGVLILFGLGNAGLLPAVDMASTAYTPLMFISTLAAMAYAAGLAVRWESLQRAVSSMSRHGEARYQMLAEHMTDLLTRHTRSGNVIFASPAAEQLLDVPANVLLGKGLFERVHVADRPAFLRALSETAVHGKRTSVEFRLRRDRQARESEAGYVIAPEFLWVEMSCNPAETDGQDGHDIIAVTRDISIRKQQESELMAAREDADRASAAKTRFLASMSHELRTPLNAIIGFSELLANEHLANVDAARRHEYANLIHDSGHHLLSVVNGILDMSKIESGNFLILPEPFELRPLISSCVQLFALKAEHAHVRLDAFVPDDLPEVVADKRACKQILINLLSNAIKFTPAEGSVSVYAQIIEGFATLVVADTGVGIAEEDLPRLGDPFFQAGTSYDRPYEGTGLGLSVVKGLVELHHGELLIESRRGEGTKVSIRLPLEPEKPHHKAFTPPENMVEMPKQQTLGSPNPLSMTSVNVSKVENKVKLRA
jgi:cell cycle sensor histidine kinase DivJ